MSLVSIVLLIDRDPLRQRRAEGLRANHTFALTHCIVVAQLSHFFMANNSTKRL